LLIARGAEVDERDIRGRTALIHASKDGDREAVQLLLAAGAKVNGGDFHGFTALIYASGNNNRELLELLLAAGQKSMPRTLLTEPP
jgi:ankyrin repeat protein